MDAGELPGVNENYSGDSPRVEKGKVEVINESRIHDGRRVDR